MVTAPDSPREPASPGLSGSAHASLAGTELVDLLKAPVPASASSPQEEEVKEQTRRLRRNVSAALQQGHAYKALVRIKPQKKKNKLMYVPFPRPPDALPPSSSPGPDRLPPPGARRTRPPRQQSSSTPFCT